VITNTDFCHVFNFICFSFAGACPNQNVTNWVASFQPSSYPSNYGPNLDCYWLIQVSDGNLIEINFQDFAVNNDMGVSSLLNCSLVVSFLPSFHQQSEIFIFQMDGDAAVRIHFLSFIFR